MEQIPFTDDEHEYYSYANQRMDDEIAMYDTPVKLSCLANDLDTLDHDNFMRRVEWAAKRRMGSMHHVAIERVSAPPRDTVAISVLIISLIIIAYDVWAILQYLS